MLWFCYSLPEVIPQDVSLLCSILGCYALASSPRKSRPPPEASDTLEIEDNSRGSLERDLRPKKSTVYVGQGLEVCSCDTAMSTPYSPNTANAGPLSPKTEQSSDRPQTSPPQTPKPSAPNTSYQSWNQKPKKLNPKPQALDPKYQLHPLNTQPSTPNQEARAPCLSEAIRLDPVLRAAGTTPRASEGRWQSSETRNSRLVVPSWGLVGAYQTGCCWSWVCPTQGDPMYPVGGCNCKMWGPTRSRVSSLIPGSLPPEGPCTHAPSVDVRVSRSQLKRGCPAKRSRTPYP